MIWVSPLLVGSSLSILGGGGSILVVPILIYLFNLDPKIAIAYSLVIVGLTSLVGVLKNYKRISYNNVLKLGITASLGTFIGAKISPFIPSNIQMIIFSLTMLITAYKMIIKRKEQSKEKHKLYLPILGIFIGILSGIIGVGGGFLLVPVLIASSGLKIKEAIPSSLLIISFNSFFGTIGYLNIIDFNLNLIAGFILISSIGMLVGDILKDKMNEQQIKKTFAITLILIASFILYNNL